MIITPGRGARAGKQGRGRAAAPKITAWFVGGQDVLAPRRMPSRLRCQPRFQFPPISCTVCTAQRMDRHAAVRRGPSGSIFTRRRRGGERRRRGGAGCALTAEELAKHLRRRRGGQHRRGPEPREPPSTARHTGVGHGGTSVCPFSDSEAPRTAPSVLCFLFFFFPSLFCFPPSLLFQRLAHQRI